MTRPVVAFQIRGKDPQRLAEFYRELFGWEIAGANPMGIMSIPARHWRAGRGRRRPHHGGGSAGREHLRAGPRPERDAPEGRGDGRPAVMQPFDVPGGPTIAQMADPEGNLVGLVKQ